MPDKPTDKEAIPPPISGLPETRGGCHRSPLNRADNVGQLTLSRETVVPGSSDAPNSQRLLRERFMLEETRVQGYNQGGSQYVSPWF